MKVLTPIDLGPCRVPNRVILTAMVTRLSGEDGLVNQPIIDRYKRFSEGESGLIVVEATSVHGAKSGPLLRLNSDEFIPGHRKLVQEVKAAGPSKLALQIIHFLKIARSGWRQTIDMLSLEEISQIVEDYAQASERAARAGYDAVELHMAHAYTQSSFLSRRNPRRDQYGGQSLESRMRLMSETIRATRRAVGPSFCIGLRFDGEECIKGGYGLAESKLMAERMAELGVDYISISAGGKFEDAEHREGEVLYPYTGYSGDRTMPAAQYPDGANAYLASGIKAHLVRNGFQTPVVASGKIKTPEMANEILKAGEADLIGMARQLLADPDWPKKLREDRHPELIRCVYGNVCKALDEKFREVRCVLWPKGELHAPSSQVSDEPVPAWPEGSELGLEIDPGRGRIVLSWPKAELGAATYGYEIVRKRDDRAPEYLHNQYLHRFVDVLALAGHRYEYRVRAYDRAGRRSKEFLSATIHWPLDVSESAPDVSESAPDVSD